MEEVFYQKGDIVIRQDDIGDCFYVLEEGLVSVTVSVIIFICIPIDLPAVVAQNQSEGP